MSSQILVYEVEEDDDNIIGEVIASEGDLIGQLREKVGVELELGNSFPWSLTASCCSTSWTEQPSGRTSSRATCSSFSK